jgi:NTE family protein
MTMPRGKHASRKRSSAKRRTVGLALGGGWARGIAHIGVLKALREAAVPIDRIVGTSMGALVGGLYAATGDIEFLEHVFSKLTRDDVLPLHALFTKKHGTLFRDQALARELETKIKGVAIERCAIPFAAVATDVENGRPVVLDKGPLVDAIRASTALPIIFNPVKFGGRLLMDGGFSDPVPADVARAKGAAVVIAVDVTSRWLNVADEPVSLGNMTNVLSNILSAAEYQLARPVLATADVVLRPPVFMHGRLAFGEAAGFIAAGENEVRVKIADICRAAGCAVPEQGPLERIFGLIAADDGAR